MSLRGALELLWEESRGSPDLDPSEPTDALATAQTILEATGITIPSGDLADRAYDAFGNEYRIPQHIVSDPINVAPEEVKMSENSEADGVGDSEENEEDKIQRREEKGKAVIRDPSMIVKVVARLSERGGRDIVVEHTKGQTVRAMTKAIFEASGLPSSKHITLAFSGRRLNDPEKFPVDGWQEGYVVNAFVFDKVAGP